MRGGFLFVSVLLFATIGVIASTTSASYADSSVGQQPGPDSAKDELTSASGSNRFVVWQDSTPGNSDIFFRRSTDNGATWKPVVNLSINAGQSTFPQIAVSGTNVYVVWQDSTPGNSDIFFRRSTDNGATWKPVVNLNTNAGTSAVPEIAAAGSEVYVVWSDLTPGRYDILFNHGTDYGMTWKSIENLSNNALTSFYPQVKATGSNVYVVWQDSALGNYDALFRRSTDNGATWKPVVNLRSNSGTSERPQIAVSGANVYVVWHDNTPGNFDIFFRRSTDNGATWKGILDLSVNAGSSISAQIGV